MTIKNASTKANPSDPMSPVEKNGIPILPDWDEKVPFTRSNAKQCICWQCPVQADSVCIKENGEKMGEVMSSLFFVPEIVPGLYCSSGVAACKDLDVSKPCICYKCPVFDDYHLVEAQPIDHYCKNGMAR